ncbi:MAG TPA: DnaB-like helicase C-terminal domain-containing protein [Gemmatimonadaceae bacterium]|nr:DnaB-like helicase C-terminal domain-containing protein [Gemmatimonadaceae bacterium]
MSTAMIRTVVKACPTCSLPSDLCPFHGDHQADPVVQASDQIAGALLDLDVAADDYLRWPWATLDELYGGMAPGTVHYVVGFSGSGKSTFIASAIRRWAGEGRRVDVLPLEVHPAWFRTYLACQELGIDPGIVRSGDFHRREDAAEIRDRVKAELHRQFQAPFRDLVHVHSTTRITAQGFRAAVTAAVANQASVLVVDHVDHIGVDGDGGTPWQASLAVNNLALDLATDTGLVIVLMSQANQEALRGSADHLAKYQPVREHHVLYGGHKRQVATGMLGLYRPLLPAPPRGTPEHETWKKTLADARAGLTAPTTALEPRVCGVSLMKSRNYGGREGQRVKLAWRAGQIVEHHELPYTLRRVS